MLIIPAIDLILNKVVKAKAGQRAKYRKLLINFEDYSDPIKFINLLSKNFKFRTIYIANLDSIEEPKKKNFSYLKKLIYLFPNINFWIDVGIANLTEIDKFNELINCNHLKKNNFRIVIGTESFKKKKDISRLPSNCIISLDFNGTEANWYEFINKKSETIFMFIKKVGGLGINWEQLDRLENIFCKKNCFIAGGIRNNDDIKKLERRGYKGILVSSIIHKKIRARDFYSP